MRKQSIVIFGTGNGGKNVWTMLQGFGHHIEAFIDNDRTKWGSMFNGVRINAPDSLFDSDAAIVIASTWEEEIRAQLAGMGLDNRIVAKEVYMYEYLQQCYKEYEHITNMEPDEKKKMLTFVFSLDLGLYNGGVESWAYTVADGLRKRGFKTKFLTTNLSAPAPERFAEDTYYLPMRGENCVKGIEEIAGAIIENAPCIMIDSWQSMGMLTTAIVRKNNRWAVPCFIEVIHNDLPRLFRGIKCFESTFDYCMAVSRDINCEMMNAYGVDSRKVRYKESPVYFGTVEREYALDNNMPIRIGYGARLEKSQKRADLLIPLIERLETRQIPYKLQIAGTGNWHSRIEEFIRERHLEEKVEMMGFLPREQMDQFWSGQDIFINLSEYEGVGLSMLEAIGYGCVPVVMEVAGSREFIETDAGFVCRNGDLDEMVDAIQFLAENRHQIEVMGALGKDRIRVKCSVEQYVDYLLKLVEDKERDSDE